MQFISGCDMAMDLWYRYINRYTNIQGRDEMLYCTLNI